MASLQRSLASLLQKEGIQALLVSDMTNITYLTGCRISAGRVLVTSSRITLYTDARYRERVEKEAKRFIVHRSFEELQKDLLRIKKLGIEADHVTLSQFARWKKTMKNTKLVQVTGLLEGLRRSKNDHEIKSIKRACFITKRILKQIPSLLHVGMTERDLAWKIHEHAQRYGADELAFPTIVGFGEHTSIPHHEPTSRRLKKNDLVQIDMGVKVDGYCSDYSRVFSLSPFTDEQMRVYSALQEAKKSAEQILKPGVTNHALDAAARDVLQKHDMDQFFTHALGHGLGLDIHEGITLSAKAPMMKLLHHEAMTIEPGVYFPGKWGMRLEDTYIVH